MKLDKEIIDSYIKTIRENIRVEKCNGGLVFSLPFYISGGHFVEIFAKQWGKYIKFSDKTRTIGDLFLSGMNIPGKNKALINKIVERYQLLQINNNEIVATAKMEDAGKVLHQLILALINVGNLEILNTLKLYQPEKIVRKVREIVESVAKVPFKYGPTAVVPGVELEKINFDFVLENGGVQAIQTIDVQKALDNVTEAWAFKLDDAWKKNNQIYRTIIYNPEMEQWNIFEPILRTRSEAIISITDIPRISETIRHSA